eukprot:6620697-Prymnesium_polylepis.1
MQYPVHSPHQLSVQQEVASVPVTAQDVNQQLMSSEQVFTLSPDPPTVPKYFHNSTTVGRCPIAISEPQTTSDRSPEEGVSWPTTAELRSAAQSDKRLTPPDQVLAVVPGRGLGARFESKAETVSGSWRVPVST